MPSEPSIEMRGWHELAAGTAALAKETEQAAHDQFRSVASQVAGRARALVPYRSGRAAGSVEVVAGPPVGVGAGGGVPYYGWLEFGGTRGRPYIGQGRYLFPAAQAAEPLLATAGARAAESATKGATWQSPK